MNRISRTSRLGGLAAWPSATLLLGTAMAFILGNWANSFRNPGDLALLVALSLATYLAGAIDLPSFRIDVGLVLALAALVLTGPMGALAVVAIPELIRPIVERGTVRRIATVANLASFAWMVLIGQALLLALPLAHADLIGRGSAFALIATAMALANTIIVQGILAGLVDQVLISGWRREARTQVATLALVPFGALTAALIAPLGILALAAAAAAEACLILVVRLVTWTPRAGHLTVPEARARYAAAIASRLSLSSAERRVLRAAARAGTGRVAVWLSASERDRVAKTLLLAGLWSRSDAARDDCFSRLQPAEMTIESRVLLVAHAWAGLTAMGTEQLEHRLALLTLHNNPRRYDRRVVELARDLVPEAERQAPRARVPHTRALSRRIAQLNTAP